MVHSYLGHYSDTKERTPDISSNVPESQKPNQTTVRLHQLSRLSAKLLPLPLPQPLPFMWLNSPQPLESDSAHVLYDFMCTKFQKRQKNSDRK